MAPADTPHILSQNIQLRKDLIRTFIDREFQGNTSAFGRSLELKDLPHRKTILRWASGEDASLPKGAKRLLALAQALDVDPFMLLDLKPKVFIDTCLKSGWNMSWGSIHKSLAFLNDLFKLSEEAWPPEHMAELFDGHWYTHEFSHHPQGGPRNYFQPLYLKPDLFYSPEGNPEGPRNPQLWYFAYREARKIDGELQPCGFWRPYGMVFIYQKMAYLLHLSGMVHELPLEDTQGEMIIETFFGQGASQFKIASLHPFEARLLSGTSETAVLPTLRFDFPE